MRGASHKRRLYDALPTDARLKGQCPRCGEHWHIWEMWIVGDDLLLCYHCADERQRTGETL